MNLFDTIAPLRLIWNTPYISMIIDQEPLIIENQQGTAPDGNSDALLCHR